MKSTRSFIILIFLNSAIFTLSLTAQNAEVAARFGKGITITAPDSSMSMKFSTRFQTLFVAETALEENANIEKEMMIRRARLKFDGFAFDPRLEYKIELALSNRDNAAITKETGNGASIVLDAVLKYALLDNLEIWFGQTKLPGNRERVISSQALQFVDRSFVNSYYNIDRDLGLQLHHKLSLGQVVIKDKYAISLGQGRNITIADTGGFSYTGRLELLPLGEFTNKGDYFDADLAREKTPKISLGAGYSINDNAVRKGGELGSFLSESRDLHTFFADLMLKYRGWSLTSEYMDKRAERTPVLKNYSSYFQTGRGWNIQSGYLFKNNFEIAGRYTMIVPEESIVNLGFDQELTEYTLAFSRYIKGHNLKIQSDVSYLTESNSKNNGSARFRLQVEMAL